MKAIEKLPSVTPAEIIRAINFPVTDIERAPKVERRRVTGPNLLLAVQRANGEQTTYTADGAIAIQSGTVLLAKTGSAGAFTLAAPTAAQAGTRLRIINQTAFAHVITSTDNLDDGVTGGAKDTATFGAFAGASLELEAVNLKWSVVSKHVCTIAAV
jgi:hypothetical protein